MLELLERIMQAYFDELDREAELELLAMQDMLNKYNPPDSTGGAQQDIAM